MTPPPVAKLAFLTDQDGACLLNIQIPVDQPRTIDVTSGGLTLEVVQLTDTQLAGIGVFISKHLQRVVS